MAQSLELTVLPTCISSGYCRNTAPEVFGALPNKKSYVLTNPVPDSPVIQTALEGCPVEAIVAKDAESGEQAFP